MRLIDADELLRYIESKGRLSGVAEIVKNDIIRNIYKMMQSLSAQAQPKPNKLDELIQGYGHTTGIIQIFNEISNQLKELRGERD